MHSAIKFYAYDNEYVRVHTTSIIDVINLIGIRLITNNVVKQNTYVSGLKRNLNTAVRTVTLRNLRSLIELCLSMRIKNNNYIAVHRNRTGKTFQRMFRV